LIVTVALVGFGAACLEADAADPAAGQSSPLPIEAPVAAAVLPIKARRESACRAWCDDDGELDETGQPPLSNRNCGMVPTPKPS